MKKFVAFLLIFELKTSREEKPSLLIFTKSIGQIKKIGLQATREQKTVKFLFPVVYFLIQSQSASDTDLCSLDYQFLECI